MKLSTLIYEAYSKTNQRQDLRHEVRDAVADIMYLKDKDSAQAKEKYRLPKTMYERVGSDQPPLQKIKHKLKTIRDIKTSNTVTNNRGLIRDDVTINIDKIYKNIQEVTEFSGPLNNKQPLNMTNQTQVRKIINPDLTTHLIPKESNKSLSMQRGWQNIKGGK